MESINNLLKFFNENWTAIVIMVGLLIGFYEKVKSYLATSKEEKIRMAKEQISEIILKLVADAEEDYEAYRHAGEIKRAQVLKLIYEKYPVLAKVVSKEELIVWLDEQIDAALEILRDILNEDDDPEDVIEEAFVDGEKVEAPEEAEI